MKRDTISALLKAAQEEIEKISPDTVFENDHSLRDEDWLAAYRAAGLIYDVQLALKKVVD